MAQHNRKISRCWTTRSVLRQNERLCTVWAPKLGEGKKATFNDFLITAITLWILNYFFLVGSKLPSSRTDLCFCTLLDVFSDSKLLYNLGKEIPKTPLTTARFLKYYWPFFNVMHETINMCYRGTFNRACQTSRANFFWRK